MTKRTEAVKALRNYFDKKGGVLSAYEYSHETDSPIRYPIVRAMFGTWSRMEKVVMAKAVVETVDGPITDVDEVIRARNEALLAQEEKWKNAGENQEAKMKLQAQAQVIAEKLALNAATAAGANENKLAIGGPLPSEQQDYTTFGATVKIDPVTKEQTPIDTQPVMVEANPVVAPEDEPDGHGQTPAEIKAHIANVTVDSDPDVETGKVPVGKKTDGGSSGTPSVGAAAKLAS